VDSSTLAGLEPGTTPFKVGKGSVQAQRSGVRRLDNLRVENSGVPRALVWGSSLHQPPAHFLSALLPEIAPSKVKFF
jgi:hypothetical protein